MRTRLVPGTGDDVEGQETAVRDVRVWTRKGMVVVRTLVPTNFI